MLRVSVHVCVKQFHGHLSRIVNFALLHFKWWVQAWPAVIKYLAVFKKPQDNRA